MWQTLWDVPSVLAGNHIFSTNLAVEELEHNGKSTVLPYNSIKADVVTVNADQAYTF